MQVYQTVLELIDMRSFSNLWFWIALAVMWSTTSHWVLGVPYDMVQRASKVGGTVQDDLQTLVRINVNRLLHIGQVSGLWLAGLAAFVLTALAVLAVAYRVEFAQAVLCLLAPMTLVGLLSLRTARRIDASAAEGAALNHLLTGHRRRVQAIGMLSILFTSMWGMWQNMQIGAL